jgi:hypothetical protein
MSYQDDLIDDMETLTTGESENDLQNDLPLFQPSAREGKKRVGAKRSRICCEEIKGETR